ncbi:unnamed protein product [Victoria cruziana]
MGWRSSSRSMRKERREGGIVGCMSGVLQLFDFHLRGAIDCTGSPISQASAPSRSDDLAFCCTAGIEAPRNSLEVLPDANSGSPPQLRSHRLLHGHGDEIDDIPIAFEIFTRSESARDWTQPDTRRKRRSVVARLMGLDVLPDYAENGTAVRRGGEEERRKNSVRVKPVNDSGRGNGDADFQRLKETKLKERNREFRAVEGTVRQELQPLCCRSLPESPRISSARRSDVERRLSLQIQKENIPPFVNVNYVDSCSLGSLLRASSSSTMNSDTRKTSPRLVLSSNSPRVGKTREEKAQPRPSGTPPCSPRLKNRGSQENSNAAASTTTIITVVAAAATTTVAKPSLPRNKRTYPPQSTEPRSKSNGLGGGINNSINGKPKSEGLSLLRERSDAIARVQRQDRAPSPRIRESYVKVADRSNGDAMRKGQRPICEQALLKAHSVISATKDSPRQLRTSAASESSPLPRSRRRTAAAVSDIRQDRGSVTTDLCNHLMHHDHSDKERCMDPPPSPSLSSPPAHHDSPSSSSLSSFLSSSATTSSASSSYASSSSSFSREKNEAFFLVYPYIKTIFEMMGVGSNSRVSLLNWHSPSHPLDPAIFIRLDAFHHRRHDDSAAMDGRMPNTRSNKKLIFHLVDELLKERLKLHMGIAPWMTMMKSPPSRWPPIKVARGGQLLEAVWADVRGFPSADCKIVHDVDVLVANDVLTGHHSSPINDSGSEASAEAVLFRIGREISDELVAEVVADFLPAPVHHSNPSPRRSAVAGST